MSNGTKRPRGPARELAETESRLESLLLNAPGVAYHCANDPRWTMIYISGGCERLTGYTAEELVDNRAVAFGELIHPDDRDGVWNAVQEATRERRAFQIEYRIRTKHGEEKWVWEQGAAVFEGDEIVGHEGVVHDVSERKRAEDDRERMELQMHAGRRMEAVGRLAGGLAHDFNNLLTVIQGHARFLIDDGDLDESSRADATAILSAAERAGRLTKQLLAFTQQQRRVPKVVDLNGLVAELETKLRRLLGEDISFETRLASDLGPVVADVGQIEQVLTNLATNARDSIQGSGAVTIETSSVDGDRVPAGLGALDAVRYVALTIVDTGEGMNEDVRSQAFEPFFTTKEAGPGMGLGLSTVYGIVQQSGGHIELESVPGRGTTFRIYLPEACPSRGREALRREPARELEGNETILVVEDETAVRRVAVRILRGHGYRVLEASDGREALFACERHRGPIHLVLSDVVMPRMSGPELVEILRALSPEIRVVLTSGCVDGAPARHLELDSETPFLPKPFSIESLLRTIRETLDS